MTREEAITELNTFKIGAKSELGKTALDMAIKSLEQEPCRGQDDYENEIEDLHNRLDIAEYDKEKLREKVTNLEEKIKELEREDTLDKIRTEIKQEYKVECEHPYGQGLRRAMEIVDKYKSNGGTMGIESEDNRVKTELDQVKTELEPQEESEDKA